MRCRQKSAGWFAALRRDRTLFALAATLVLLTHLFQPLAEANAANTAKAWVICTMFGAEKAAPDANMAPPIAAADCPTCIGGPCAGLDAPPRLLTGSEPAFAAPAANADKTARFIEAEHPPRFLHGPPPAIRAPPFFA